MERQDQTQEEITPQVFAQLVKLAALELDLQEGEYLRRQLNQQLKAIHELSAIPLEPGTPPASHGVPYTEATEPALRPDTWVPFPNPQEILAQSPETEEGYIVVPEIPHTDI